jgi:hypothetical protein
MDVGWHIEENGPGTISRRDVGWHIEENGPGTISRLHY